MPIDRLDGGGDNFAAMSRELAILGAGNMAEAIVRGLLRQARFAPQQIIASDVSPQRRELFSEALAIAVTDDNRAAAREAKTLLLCVKPQHMDPVLAGIRDILSTATLVISIAAGVTTRRIELALGPSKPWRIIRVMPNTPMLVGEGMAAIARGRNATDDDAKFARSLFESSAHVIEVVEQQLDAVTAVSGSGPAYVFFLVEQMIRAAVDLGLSDAHARELAITTALGSARMLAGSADTPQELRRKVTSPGGTTEAALKHLEQHHADRIIVDAIKAAAQRSTQLGQ